MSEYEFKCNCRPGDTVYVLETDFDEDSEYAVDLVVTPKEVDAIMSVRVQEQENEFRSYPAYYVRWEGYFEIGKDRWDGQERGYYLTEEDAENERLRLLSIINK